MLRTDGARPARQSRHAASVCATCLAADRALFSLQNTPQFVNICSGLNLSMADMICFECRAILGNFVKFRSRALRAEKLLECVPTSCNFKNSQSSSGLECLSTLSKIVISAHNTFYIDNTLVEVKEEVFHSNLQVKQERSETIVMPFDPYFQMDCLKTEGYSSTEEEAMNVKTEAEERIGVKNHDEKMETWVEVEEVKPQKLQIEFIVKPIDRSEVLANFEHERATERYKRAPYKCHTCALPFRLEQKLIIHNTLHSEERGNFKCEICEQRYKDSATLKQHSELHYRTFGCPRCARTDYDLSKITAHYKQVHDDTTTRACKKCPARFTTAIELRRHTRHRHENHMCHHCNRQFTAKLSLDRHLRHSHTKVRPLQCPFCHKTYKGALNLKVHVRNAHENTNRNVRSEDAYCAECDIQFRDTRQYKTHLKTSKHLSDGAFNYWCDYCGKKYAQKKSLIAHVEEKHLKLLRYECGVCEQMFYSKESVLEHRRKKHRSTPKVKKHVCEICAKAFSTRKCLEDHMNTHLGVRPYECEHCGATFAYSAALYNHNQLVHLKKKRGHRALD